MLITNNTKISKSFNSYPVDLKESILNFINQKFDIVIVYSAANKYINVIHEVNLELLLQFLLIVEDSMYVI